MKSNRIPPRLFHGSGMTSSMANIADMKITREAFSEEHHKGRRRVMGYPIAEWQRGLEWNDEQKRRFIQSIYSGIYLGCFVYNDAIGKYPQLDGLLIDGQQRLSTIESYLSDGFAVEGPDGHSYFWSQLTKEERAHFYRIPFGFMIVNVDNEPELKHLYNLLNFGGTPHKESQRA